MLVAGGRQCACGKKLAQDRGPFVLRPVAADAERAARAPGSWIVTDAPRLPLAGVVPARDDAFPFLGCEVQYDAGSGWSGSTTAWFARDGRCVAVDR